MKPHVDYIDQAWTPVSTQENWRVILRLEGIQRRVTKLIKKRKRLQLHWEIGEIKIDYLIRKMNEI